MFDCGIVNSARVNQLYLDFDIRFILYFMYAMTHSSLAACLCIYFQKQNFWQLVRFATQSSGFQNMTAAEKC